MLQCWNLYVSAEYPDIHGAVTDSEHQNSNIGAVAELFDISCLYGTPAFDTVQDEVSSVWNSAPASSSALDVISQTSIKSSIVLGEHYYVPNPITGTGINPKWDFTSKAYAGNANAYVVAAKSAGLSAPTGSQDIDWVYLKAITGDLAAEVYRTDTRLGQPPASVCFSCLLSERISTYYLSAQCSSSDTSVLSVKYVAKYCECLA